MRCDRSSTVGTLDLSPTLRDAPPHMHPVNIKELKTQAKAGKIPKYYKMDKAQLLSALGRSAEAKAHKSQTTRRKAIAFQAQLLPVLGRSAEAKASKEGGDSATKKALVKGRLVRSVKRGVVAEEKKQGRKLTQEEKRIVAAKALASEVKAIKSGKPESKAKRGDGQKPKGLTTEQQQQVGNDLKRILSRDRHGRIAEAMAQGNEKMLRSLAREQMLNHSRVMFKDFKPHEDAIVAAFKAKDSQPPAKHSIATFKRKPDPESVEQKIKLSDVKTPEDRAAYAKQEAAHQRSLGNEAAAKSWEGEAKKARKAAVDRDIASSKNSQTSLFGVTDHASDMPLFGGQSAESPKKPASAPSGLAEVSPHDLNFDPKRFQYKMVHGGKTGESGSLTDVRKWDENLGGVMQVWRDPKDGKDYVVNGHNRATLARKLGAEKVAVRYLAVDTPHEARAIGALTNIAEGRGNALDAAKFFRDSGITREDLEAKGIPLTSSPA